VLDPVADKLLTTAAFLAFLAKGVGDGIVWIVFLVLFREFIITSLRLVVVSSGGKVIAANIWGKAKTVSQMAAILIAIAGRYAISLFETSNVVIFGVDIATNITLWVSAILTVVSGIIYVIQNKDFINPKK
jgi:CDP-diacylglycerol--glycerol-3-phosphate 3-phosphatidyltransferase